MTINPLWFQIVSEFLINIAAGWAAAAIAVGFSQQHEPSQRAKLLLYNSLAGIVSLVGAFYIRQFA